MFSIVDLCMASDEDLAGLDRVLTFGGEAEVLQKILLSVLLGIAEKVLDLLFVLFLAPIR